MSGYSVFLPGNEYIPDGEPRVFNNRLYLYGSHDRFNGDKFCLNDYVLWSAPIDDLSDWKCHGVIYKKIQDPNNKDGKMSMYAPDCVQGIDGRYYLYYCLSDLSVVSVAVCDKPDGKFEFYGFLKDQDGNLLGQREDDFVAFDPALLVDDDKRIWLYLGNGPIEFLKDNKKNKASVVMELEDDMLTLISESVPLIPTIENSKGTSFENHEFFEASSIRKFNGKYYFIYSSINIHELCYAISDYPNKNFIYQGVLVSNGDVRQEYQIKSNFRSKADKRVLNYMGNNHGSLAYINNNYYIFFHRHTSRNMFSRQACAEKIEMLEDGTFIQASLTSCGLSLSPLKGKGRYEARIACHLLSKDGALFGVHPMIQNKNHPAFTQEGADQDKKALQYIENMRDGATAGFRYFEFEGNESKISIKIRASNEGYFLIKDAIDGKEIGRIPIKKSKDFTNFSGYLKVETTTSSLYFTYMGEGYADFLEFTIE